jgi:drug/metabolite transporter (DMT)-like permease
MRQTYLVGLIAMNLIWASSYSVFKHLGAELPAGALATLRFGLSAIILLGLWPWLPGSGPRGRDLVRCLLMGVVVFCLAPRLQVEGVQRGLAADGSVLVALEPLVTSVAAALWLGEHVAPRRWLGFALGMGGVLCMAEVWRPGFRLPGLVPNLLIVGSFFCEATYSVMGKPLLGRVGLHKVVGVALAGGTAANLLWDGDRTLSLAPGLSGQAWGWLLYLAVVLTVFGYCFWFVVIREVEVNVAALTIFAQPVAGVILAIAWLGESIHWGQAWGTAAIVAGLILGLRQRAVPDRRDGPEEATST